MLLQRIFQQQMDLFEWLREGAELVIDLLQILRAHLCDPYMTLAARIQPGQARMHKSQDLVNTHQGNWVKMVHKQPIATYYVFLLVDLCYNQHPDQSIFQTFYQQKKNFAEVSELIVYSRDYKISYLGDNRCQTTLNKSDWCKPHLLQWDTNHRTLRFPRLYIERIMRKMGGV